VIAADRDSFIWWQWIFDHLAEIQEQTVEHLRLTVLAVTIGLALSVVLAMMSLRWRRLYVPITLVTGILYTIPSIALFFVLLSITGFSTTTVEIALVSYTLLILVRNIVTGIDGVPAHIREAADGMGYTRWRRFFRIELPLALPAIIAGIRIATVTTIGLVAVGGLIGSGGYGFFINEGLGRDFSTEVVLGASLSIAMAVLFDVLLAGVQRLATPWVRRGAAR